MEQEINKDQVVQAGLELVGMLIKLAIGETDQNGFLNKYMDDLTSDNGIYKKQQDAMLKFSDSSKHIEEIAQGILNSTNQNSAVIDQMNMSFENLNENIERVFEQRKLLNAKMAALNSQIKKITELIGNIQEISAQTKLLSFNASIEAAHAGEAGKGFRIIANEVKNLSNKTATISNDIASNISELSNKIYETTSENSSHDDFLNDIKLLAKNSTDALEKIRMNANDSAHATEQMYKEVKENQENILRSSEDVEKSNIEQIKNIADRATTNLITINDRISFLLELKSLFLYIKNSQV